MKSIFLFLTGITGHLPVIGGDAASKAAIISLLAASALMVTGMASKELNILKWVGIALAVISTIFTLAIVGAHLSGRLIGIGKVGLIGIVGAELMAIVCAWLAASEIKKIAGVAMICQIVLTAVLLINASVAIDLDWQETQASKASERTMAAQKLAAEEQRKLIEKQAELASQLAAQDKRLAREFVRSGKATPKLPASPDSAAETSEAGPINVANLSVYERYGLTIVPLFLALLTVIALALAAHSGSSSGEYGAPQEQPTRHQMGFGGGAPQLSEASKRTIERSQGKYAPRQ